MNIKYQRLKRFTSRPPKTPLLLPLPKLTIIYSILAHMHKSTVSVLHFLGDCWALTEPLTLGDGLHIRRCLLSLPFLPFLLWIVLGSIVLRHKAPLGCHVDCVHELETSKEMKIGNQVVFKQFRIFSVLIFDEYDVSITFATTEVEYISPGVVHYVVLPSRISIHRGTSTDEDAFRFHDESTPSRPPLFWGVEREGKLLAHFTRINTDVDDGAVRSQRHPEHFPGTRTTIAQRKGNRLKETIHFFVFAEEFFVVAEKFFVMTIKNPAAAVWDLVIFWCKRQLGCRFVRREKPCL